MRKITSLGMVLFLSLLSFVSKAEIYFDLTAVSGAITLGYDDVSTERLKAQDERWISVTNFGGSGTAGLCSGVSKTFDIKSGRIIDFYLAKCDSMVINANIAEGRGLVVNIDDGANIQLNGTGACKDYVVAVNKESNVKISVQGLTSKSAWTSLFNFYYAEKYPKITLFKINNISAAINDENKTITQEMPYGTDITNVTPEVTIGGTATSYSPVGAQNFTTGTIVYTATDGSESTNYDVNITVKTTPDTEKAITALSINGRTATINEETGEITCEFPSFEGPLADWSVEFTLNSETANADFTSGSNHDFGANSSLTITVTAQDNSTKVYTVTASVSTKKNIGILSLNGAAESYDDLLVSAFSNYFVTFIKAESTTPSDIADFYSNYDMLVLHANVSGTNATGVAAKQLVGVKPILNLKAFFYSSGRWSWSSVNPGNSTAGVGSADVETLLQNHPIFQNVSFDGTTLNYYDNLPATNTNAVQYANDVDGLADMTSHTIATFNSTGIQIHEIQNNLAAKYLLIALSIENDNYTYFNSNTINILKNTAEYLLDPTAQYNYNVTSLNDLSNKMPVYYNKDVIYNDDQNQLEIYNMSGICLMNSKEKLIDTSVFIPGIYIVKINGVKAYKFIK
ncbi:MAG: T9SS type A sorting domain-containing protein [Paludibacter sp.]|nr:T9SS type A sorting domain-containing protein [Paludibacter sp.]